jgi:hypothetical protein
MDFQMLQSEMEKLCGKLVDYVKQQKVLKTDMQTRVQKLKVSCLFPLFSGGTVMINIFLEVSAQQTV